MTVVFLDIDGTIADCGWRFNKAGMEPKKRGKDYSKWLREIQNPDMLRQDRPVRGMIGVAWGLYTNLIYLTGRSEIYREITEQWLCSKGFPTLPPLMMRPKGSRRSAGLFKQTAIDSVIQPGDNVVVIDDDHTGELEAICKVRGWTFLKARSGS